MQKTRLALSVLSTLHVAYVGNGCSIKEIEHAVSKVRHMDATQFNFGETFEQTLSLNSPRYQIFEDRK